MAQTTTDIESFLRKLIKQSANMTEMDDLLRQYLKHPVRQLRESDSPCWFSYYFESKADLEQFLDEKIILEMTRFGVYIFVKDND